MTNGPIKFRAWDGLNKKFSYWTIDDLCAWGEDKERPNALDEWQRFTGLLDKNGKEIYEGDIVQMDGDWSADVKDIREIRWLQVAQENGTPFEIIGNIYENKDLLT